MGFIFGGDTGQSQADVTDARKRLAAAMIQQGTDTSPVQSPWEGAARMAQALVGGLAMRKQAAQQSAADALAISAITGQPHTPPEQPKGFLSSIFGGSKGDNPGATGSNMPKVNSSGNVEMPSTGGPLPSSFLAAVDRTEGAGDYDTLFGHAQKDGPFAGTAVSKMPIRDVIAFTDPSGPYAQYVKEKVGRVATPVGKYQTVGTTLRNAVGALGLDPNLPYDQGAQDRVASYLARKRIASADTTPGRIQALRSEWEGFNNVPDAEMAQIVADLQSGATAPNVAPAIVAPPISRIQPPPVNPPVPPPTPGYVDPRMIAADRPVAPPMAPASAPGEVASLDPSIGIPTPGAAGQMRASDPAQVMPPLAGPQAALPPLPITNVGQTPNVAGVPSVIDPQLAQALGNGDRSGVGMGGNVPGSGYFPPAPTGGGQPASPQQIAQAQAVGNQSGPARLANALDSANPQQANPMANPRAQALVKAMTDPNASPQVRAMAAQTLQTIMKPPEYGFQTLPDGTILRSDPRAGTVTPIYQGKPKPEVVNGRLVNPDGTVVYDAPMSAADEARTNLEREKFKLEQDQAAVTPDIKEYKFAKENGYTGSFAQYQTDMKKSAANNTTINTGEGNKFYNTLDEKNAGIFSGLSDTGIQARSTLGQIDALDGLLKSTPTGWLAAMKQAAGEYGINTEGLNDIQAATALINKMVPTQRQPGSGTMSDADLALFKQSLPRIINQPGGNQTIINTIRGITQYQIQMGEIADKVANRELTPAEGRAAIAELPNPLSNFKAPPAGKEEEGWSAVPTDVPGVTIRRKN